MAEHVEADNVMEPQCMDGLLQRQKKERKTLQAQIQKLKHGVPKGDKKKKKEVTEEIAKLEANLDKRHTQELDQLNAKTDASKGDSVSEVTDQLELLQTDPQEVGEDGEDGVTSVAKKTSKAKKRREKKAEKGREREERIRQQDELNLQGDRHLEAQTLKQKLSALGLAVHEEDNTTLRSKTAAFMKTHPDDYLPFLSNESTGDMFTADEFDEYCNTVATTSAWGGQLELRALAEVLRIPIKVLQATGPDLTLGEDHPAEPLTLLYYRHAFGLGEHYNSVRPRRPEDEEEEVS